MEMERDGKVAEGQGKAVQKAVEGQGKAVQRQWTAKEKTACCDSPVPATSARSELSAPGCVHSDPAAARRVWWTDWGWSHQPPPTR